MSHLRRFPITSDQAIPKKVLFAEKRPTKGAVRVAGGLSLGASSWARRER